MNYRGMKFRNERVELGDNLYHDCTFEHCELVFDGHRPPNFRDNKCIDSVFVFVGAATRTLYFLSNIYHAGQGGREVIEKTFEDIRNGAFHGREVKTIAPHTVDHTLA